MDIFMVLLAAWVVFFAFNHRDLNKLSTGLKGQKVIILSAGVAAVALCLCAVLLKASIIVYPVIFLLFLVVISIAQKPSGSIFYAIPAIAFISMLSFYMLPHGKYNLVIMPLSFVVLLLTLNAFYRASIADETTPSYSAIAMLSALILIIDSALIAPRAGVVARVLFAATFALLLNVKSGKDGEYYASERFIYSAIKPAALFLILQLFIAAILKHPAFF